MTQKAAYGSNTNFIRLRRVWMTSHYEGNGTDDSLIREVLTFFDDEGKMLARKDPVDPPPRTV